MSITPRISLIVFMAASVVAIPTAHAGGFANFDMGSRRSGMMSVVGHPDDPTAVFHNPAGLADLRGTHAYFNLTGAAAFVKLRFYESDLQSLYPSDRDLKPEWNMGALPFLGVTTDLGRDDFGLGFAIYAPNLYGAALPADEPTRYEIISGGFVTVFSTLAAAWRPVDEISIAGGVSYVMAGLMANRKMNPELVVLDGFASDEDQRLRVWDARFGPDNERLMASDIDIDIAGIDNTVAFHLATLVTPVEGLRIGVSWISGMDLAMEGTAKLTDPNDTFTGEHTAVIEQPVPYTLRMGVSADLTGQWEVAADLSYWNYRIFEEQVIRLEPEISLIGSELVARKEYTDSYNLGVGARYKLDDEWALMGGVQYDWSPIKSEFLTLDNPGRDILGGSLGAHWQVSPGMKLGLTTVYNLFIEEGKFVIDVQNSRNAPPTNIHGTGKAWEIIFDIDYQFGAVPPPTPEAP